MEPFTRHSVTEALSKAIAEPPPPADPASAVRSGHGTLPPPEWTPSRGEPASAGAAVHATARPLARRTGPRAEEGWLRARAEEVRDGRSLAATPAACATFARWLAS